MNLWYLYSTQASLNILCFTNYNYQVDRVRGKFKWELIIMFMFTLDCEHYWIFWYFYDTQFLHCYKGYKDNTCESCTPRKWHEIFTRVLLQQFINFEMFFFTCVVNGAWSMDTLSHSPTLMCNRSIHHKSRQTMYKLIMRHNDKEKRTATSILKYTTKTYSYS